MQKKTYIKINESEQTNSDKIFNSESVKVLISLAVITFISQYYFFRQFGLYEDDYYHISLNLKITLSELLSFTGIRLTNWFQGHPLAFIPAMMTYMGMKSGDYRILYLIGFMILTLNSFLMYKLLRRVYPASQLFAIAGSLFFCLYPANTVKIFLTYSFTIQISISFLLLASLLYSSDKKLLSYLMIILSLFSYEPSFMVFAGIPLLFTNISRKSLKEFIKHIVIMSGILLTSFIVRYFMAEGRILEITKNFPGFLKDIGEGIIYGPFNSAKIFFKTPFTVLNEFNETLIPFAAAGVLLLLFYFILMKSVNNTENTEIKNETNAANVYMRLIAASIILIILSYTIPLLQYPESSEFGRMSSVHSSAVAGSSVLFGLLCTLMMNLFSKSIVKIIPLALIISYLSLLFVYNVLIQQDFVKSRVYQRKFWTEIKKLCPDLTDSTLIFVIQDKNNKLSSTKYIGTNSWLDPTILKQIYQFPDYWKNPPRLFLLNEGIEKRAWLNDGIKPEWRVPSVTWIAHNEFLPDSNVIVIRKNADGKLVRDYSEVFIESKTLNLRPENSPEFKSWKKGILDSYLIENE